jgi:two-component system sensor histidine kinase CreC
MSIFLRIWFAFAFVLIVGSYFSFSAMQNQIKPSMRQVVEETLADNANIIATLVSPDVIGGQVQTPAFKEKIDQILSRKLDAKIWQQTKTNVSQQLYITDSHGIVLFDSTGLATGQDYSRWNDVRLTLRGQYGARSTRSNPNDDTTSTMYVAAPIIAQGQLIGVLTLGKPGASVQPYIDQAQREMLIRALWVALLALLVSAIVAWWLRHGIDQVRRYALAITPHHAQDGEALPPMPTPRFWIARELNELTHTIDQLRAALAGKTYVENYVHTLTHELKSPLTAIAASAELLQDDLSGPDRLRFGRNIIDQTERLQLLIERLLLLAKLENQQDHSSQPVDRQPVDITALVDQLLQERSAPITGNQLQITLEVAAGSVISAEPFWLKQALGNLLDNAIDFTPLQGSILLRCQPVVELGKLHMQVQVVNDGEPIPDYALAQVFDRYFSLPRPRSQRKSTGIGLTLVREVMALHQGHARIENTPTGVCVSLLF